MSETQNNGTENSANSTNGTNITKIVLTALSVAIPAVISVIVKALDEKSRMLSNVLKPRSYKVI